MRERPTVQSRRDHGACAPATRRSRGSGAMSQACATGLLTVRAAAPRRHIVKFMLFIYPDRTVQLTAEQRSAIPEAVSAWVSEMDARGVREQGHVLQPVGEALTVRCRDGETIIRDGPFLDADPQISGFNILDCADHDEAVEVASKHPVATVGILELRPFADD